MLCFPRLAKSTWRKSSSRSRKSIRPLLYFLILLKKVSRGPPNCDQLSMHVILALLPYIAAQAVDPHPEPISRYRGFSIELIRLLINRRYFRPDMPGIDRTSSGNLLSNASALLKALSTRDASSEPSEHPRNRIE